MLINYRTICGIPGISFDLILIKQRSYFSCLRGILVVVLRTVINPNLVFKLLTYEKIQFTM